MATILIVDDLSANREVLIAVLRNSGHRLIEADNGRDALKLARREFPDLVITDVLMPTMDGYELVKHLRRDARTKRLPVIFYTAHYSEREARSLALASGVSAVLTKPVDPAAVLDVVSRALSATPAAPTGGSPLSDDFDRAHLRLVTDKLSHKDRDLTAANARLRALINVGLELGSERDVDRLLASVCASARDLFGATYVTLGLLDPTRRHLERLVSDGAAASDWIAAGDPVPGILAEVVNERRPRREEHPTGDPAALGLPAGHPPVRFFLAAPLASPTQVYGWICLAGRERAAFTEDDEAMLSALAGQVGRVYENGSLYQRAEAERDRAQHYLDAASVMLLGLDLQARVTLVNKYACDLLECSREALLGRDFIEACVPAPLRDATRAKLGEVHEGDDAPVSSPVVSQSGWEYLIEWRTTFMRDADGQLQGTLSSGTDVTAQRRAERTLRLQGSALNAAASAIVITDRAGLIEWVNPAFTSLTGYAAEEAIGRNPGDLVGSGAHDSEFYATLWQTILAGQVWKGEMVNRRKDGSQYTEDQSITPVRDESGTISHFIAVKQDSTPRRQAEQRLRESARVAGLAADVGLALTRARTVGEALQRCAEALVMHLDAAFGRIWTLNEDEAVLELLASAGQYTHLDGPHARVPVGRFKIGRIAQSLRPHLTNAVVGDPEVSDQEWARREGMVAFAGYPLVVGDRLVGVMALFAKHELTEATLGALAAVADQIGVGIDRHQQAEALRTAEARTRFALESANVGIWDADYTTGQVHWSPVAERQFGLPEGGFEKTFEAFVARLHPDDRASVLGRIDDARKSGQA
jgi:PAS domain S-box-containing protein